MTIKTNFKHWKWKKVSDWPKTWELGIFTDDICETIFGRVIKEQLEWKWFANVRLGPSVIGDLEPFRDSAMEKVNEQLEAFLN